MKMDFIILEILYQNLKNTIKFCIFTFIIILVNISFLKFKINTEIVEVLITFVSIIFGFLVTAICNMFGRKITKKMAMRASRGNKGISQLQDLKQDYKSVLINCIFVLVISILYLIARASVLSEYSTVLILYILSAICLSFIIKLMINLVYLTFVLLNFMINESYEDN